MFFRILNLLPRDLLVSLYKSFPFQGLKDWVVYRAQHKFPVAVSGVFTNDHGQILLLKHTYRKEPWGMPGGWMELETPEEGLRREVFEETGFEVKITELAKAIYNHNSNQVDLIFKGHITGGTFKACTEISEICFCEMDEWPPGLPKKQKVLIKDILNRNSPSPFP